MTSRSVMGFARKDVGRRFGGGFAGLVGCPCRTCGQLCQLVELPLVSSVVAAADGLDLAHALGDGMHDFVGGGDLRVGDSP